MNEYNIPLSYRNHILSSLTELYNNNNRYNIRVKLYNKLKKNNIDYPTIKGVPLDVLKYLYLTATGSSSYYNSTTLAYHQSVKAGEKVERGSVVTVAFTDHSVGDYAGQEIDD
jgi:hypothetical protein